jgi:malonate-semialdehyde dehydrogenase (acetylating)/methylmalonate-semialdehyde dehydrogenase
MVPMWMFPIAITVGNTFLLKPSEKVPLTATRLGALMVEAGYPPGVFQIVQGGKRAVEALADHPEVKAVAFVGSTAVARSVYARATALGKRALCLGGAKNPIIVVPDADPEVTIPGVVASFTGCAGQRCMAASLLLAVGARSEIDPLIDGIVMAASHLRLGTDMGALINAEAKARLETAIERAAADGATLRLDGRSKSPAREHEGGFWLGPTIIDEVGPESEAFSRELFGPVLSIVRVPTLDDALALEGPNDYGNALSVFTTRGAVSRRVSERARSGMVGVNIGVPVPREPFSFGGSGASKFGACDITGPSAVEFWTSHKKITSKWASVPDANWMS